MSALSHARRSRELVRSGTATLATLSEGFPYASLVQYAVTPQGCPLLLLSELAEHTQNLHLDPRASLLVWEEQAERDPLAAARVSLIGLLKEAEPASLEVYLEALPQARAYAAFKDFRLWRLEPQRIRYIAGFGEMSWVDVADYRAAEPTGG